jgi:hypothetical protein
MSKRHLKPNRNLPDPMHPGSPGYAERNAEVAVEIGSGVVRVDIETPVGLAQDLTRPEASPS